MAASKTQPTGQPVADFIASVSDLERRAECETLLPLMTRASGEDAAMWGSIIGFGRYHYRYRTGREGTFLLTGFVPRKSEMAVYIMPGLDDFASLLARLGPHRAAKSCLYLRRLSAVDPGVLEELVRRSVETMRERYR